MAADPLTSATVDDLFNFDSTDDEDPFKDKTTRNGRDDKTTLSPRPTKRKAGDDGVFGDDLGLDEEVKITKKRKPIAKLDEARLLSAQGIPKLRELALSGKFSKKLHLKGKGHEFSDVARLLNYYQLWLDNLYPRAKFADGLQLIEKVGHSKRMQIMRKEWIDEGKPGYVKDKGRKTQAGERETDDLYGGDNPVDKNGFDAAPEGDDSLFIPDARASNETVPGFDEMMPEDDDLDALLAEQETATANQAPSKPRSALDVDSEGEDDLDALLAEQETRRAPAPANSVSKPGSRPKTSPFDDDDDEDEDMDDLDALLVEQEIRAMSSTGQSRPATQTTAGASNKPAPILDDDAGGEDDDDLDALLAEQEARQSSSLKPQSSTSTANTSTAAAVQETLEAEADGNDMFSSSPIQTVGDATQDKLRDQQFGIWPSGSAAETMDKVSVTQQPAQPRAGGTQQGTSPEIVRADLDTEGQEGLQEPAHRGLEQEEEEQAAEEEVEAEIEEDQEANDMFSSSPVQND